ncbi:MAG: NPCBM/NEW2 domain-containing protein [Pirellulaceae bacterium]
MAKFTLRGVGVAWLAVVAIGLLASESVAAQPVGTVATVDGAPFSANLLGIDADWNVRLRSDSGERRVAAADLAFWGAEVESDRGPLLILADGGRLAVDQILALAGDRIAVESNLWGRVMIPLELVRGVVFHPPAAFDERDKLEGAIASSTGEQDVVLLENGDRVEGFLRAPAPLVGPQPNAPDALSKITLEVKGRDVDIPLKTITALIFNPALISPPRVVGMHARLGLDDGSLLLITAIDPGPLTSITLPHGVRLSTDAESLWEEVVFVRPATPRVVYLSDLRPIGYKHIPFLALDWPYHEDRNTLGGKLRVGRNLYSKGLGMHSASRLAYELRGDFQRFETELALDAEAGRRGSVVARIFLDRGDGAWRAGYESPVLRGGEAPISVSLDVRGVQRLAILVEFADRGDECDYLDLLNARLLR